MGVDDEFWNALRAKVSGYKPQQHSDISAVEITSEPSKATNEGALRVADGAPDTYTAHEHNREKSEYTSPRLRELLHYHSEGSLIQDVRISAYASSFNYYARFESDARRGFRQHGAPAPKVSYFAYTPQYSTLNSAQLAYYLYFRSSARRGEFIEADFSYILLYIYEILNLPDLIPPKDGAELLARLWLYYRKLYVQLDKYLVEWFPDYCLIHQLPLPTALYPVLPELASKASLKAFFIPLNASTTEARRVSARTLIRCTTDHAIKKNNPLAAHEAEAEAYIEASVAYLLERGCISASALPSTSLVRSSRDAFCGALVSSTARRRIDIEIYSAMRSQPLGAMLSSAVRYSENKVREIFRIPSRLKAQPGSEIASAIDEFFTPYLPKKEKKRDDAPEYEKLYDADIAFKDNNELISHAKKLESDSWRNVDILNLDTADKEAAEFEEADILEVAPQAESGDPFFEYRSALNAALNGEFRDYCRAHGLFEDDVAAHINELAQDIIGDSALEDSGSGYTVIEDYRELLTFSP